MNTNTLDTFVAKRQGIQHQVDDYRLVPLNLNEIHKSGNRFFNRDTELSSNSLDSLLGVLGVKSSLVEDIQDDENQWGPLHSALSNIRSNRVVTAVKNIQNNTITDIYNSPLTAEKPVDLTNGLRFTEEFLRTTESNLELRNFQFNPANLSINIDFMNPDADIDVFGDGKDFWKSGFGVSFSPNKTQTYPFFLRLVCSNGMMAIHRMKQRFVNSEDLTQKTFLHQVQQYLGNDRNSEVQLACTRLRNNNASLRELYAARSIMEKHDKDAARTIFNDEEVIKRYASVGVDIKKQNKRWLSSANSNVNSYDLFNTLTHTATHSSADVEIATRMELNRLASDMFFSGPDFSALAPDPFRVVAQANLEA